MTVLKYKDYQGSVTYEDGRLVIKILHIDDIYVSEISNASKALAAFEDLVEDYIETCKELGKEPAKPFKGSFNVRVSPELHKNAAMAALQLGQSLNSFVEDALDRYLEETSQDDEAVKATVVEAVQALRQVHVHEEAHWRRGGYEAATSISDQHLNSFVEMYIADVQPNLARKRH